jgi:Fe(3+) dicitrate transport protein
MDYAMQQSGGLTDAQFKANARQSFRERNWLGTPWNLVALNFDTKINDRLRSNTKVLDC